MIRCEECVKGLVYGTCGMPYGNAACLCTAKRWQDEPADKVLDFLERIREYEAKQYDDKVKLIDMWEHKVRLRKDAMVIEEYRRKHRES